jgi:hypothetical protein
MGILSQTADEEAAHSAGYQEGHEDGLTAGRIEERAKVVAWHRGESQRHNERARKALVGSLEQKEADRAMLYHASTAGIIERGQHDSVADSSKAPKEEEKEETETMVDACPRCAGTGFNRLGTHTCSMCGGLRLRPPHDGIKD